MCILWEGDHIEVSNISHITKTIQTDAQKKEEKHKALGKKLALEEEKRDNASHKIIQELHAKKVQQDIDFFKRMLQDKNSENYHGHDIYCEIERLNMEIVEASKALQYVIKHVADGDEAKDHRNNIQTLTKQREEHQLNIPIQGLKQQTCLRPQLQRLVKQLRQKTDDINLKKATNKQLVMFIQQRDTDTIEEAMTGLLRNWEDSRWDPACESFHRNQRCQMQSDYSDDVLVIQFDVY